MYSLSHVPGIDMKDVSTIRSSIDCHDARIRIIFPNHESKGVVGKVFRNMKTELFRHLLHSIQESDTVPSEEEFVNTSNLKQRLS